ncbi:MAG: SDR family oxidoreductase [Phycisphaerales bacterium]
MPTAPPQPSPTDARPLALITGGAVRVGRAVCLELARAGCDIRFTYRTREREALALRDELASLGVSAECDPLELDDLAAVELYGQRLATETPRVDVLIHNASIYAPTPLATVTADDLLRNYRVNAAAPLLLTRALAARLAQSPLPGGGSVVAFSDMHVLGRPRRDFSAYAMSKAALTEMVRVLAVDLAPHVRVNAVAPGVVAFPDSGYESDPEMQARYLQRVPLKRAGTPEDAAKAVRWLALEATYVTGEIVRLDGGRWLA